MGEASDTVKRKTAAINSDIESGLSGIRTAKAFANEQAELHKFDRSNETFKTSKRMFHKAMLHRDTASVEKDFGLDGSAQTVPVSAGTGEVDLGGTAAQTQEE